LTKLGLGWWILGEWNGHYQGCLTLLLKSSYSQEWVLLLVLILMVQYIYHYFRPIRIVKWWRCFSHTLFEWWIEKISSGVRIQLLWLIMLHIIQVLIWWSSLNQIMSQSFLQVLTVIQLHQSNYFLHISKGQMSIQITYQQVNSKSKYLY